MARQGLPRRRQATPLEALSRLKGRHRWLPRRHLLERKLRGRRTASKLLAVIDLVFHRPLASSDVIADALGSHRGLVAALAFSRYRG
jgi:hypothetical protein